MLPIKISRPEALGLGTLYPSLIATATCNTLLAFGALRPIHGHDGLRLRLSLYLQAAGPFLLGRAWEKHIG